MRTGGATPAASKSQSKSAGTKCPGIKIQYHARHSASKVSRLDLQVTVEARNARGKEQREEGVGSQRRVPGGI